MRNDIEVLVIDAVDRTNVVASFSMRVWVCASALFLCGYSTLAQSRLTFDVASIKENTAGGVQRVIANQPDRFTATNYPLEYLIDSAYETGVSKVVGAPSWLQSARYDIAAKSDRATTTAEKRAMVRSLLEDRFKLKLHVETTEGRVDVLTVVAAGKLGPSVRAASPECAAAADERDRNNGVTQLTCSNPFVVRPSTFRALAVTATQFANALGEMMQTPVIDQTNLQGRFDISLWADITAFLPPIPGAQVTSDGPNRPPSLFTAVQEQLGLKLTPSRGPVKTFVIDSIERPTPD